MAMLSVQQRKSLERATLQYQKNIGEVEEYLAGRGIAPEVARSNALGVVRDPIPGHEYLTGRLAIPYLTASGPVNMNFRCLKDHVCKDVPNHGKYMLWPGLESNLYNVRALDSAGSSIAICEGEIDAISSTLAGIPCVGISGATKWRDHWNNIFEDFTRVYVWQEPDSGGEKFAKRVASEVGAIRVVLRPGEDVNSIWSEHGADQLRSRIRK